MINQKDWEEFRETGLLWFINSTLHVFGWAIVITVNDDGQAVNAYPVRTKFRGFSEKHNNDGYRKVSRYMKDNAKTLEDEAFEREETT